MIGRLGVYKIFYEVAQCSSFSKAAKKLYMTQPAVSQSIMQLEKELEIRLFTRTPKGVSLTNEGQLLLEYVGAAIGLLDVGERKLLEAKNLLVGELQIGVGDTISRYFLLPYLEEFHNQYPQIKLKIINRTTLELCAMLKSGEIDIAICNLPIEDTTLETQTLINIQDVFVCGEKYKYLLKQPIPLQQLTELPLILLEPKSNSRQYVEKHLLEKDIHIKPEIELGSHDLLLEFTKINLGISCVIKQFSKEYLEQEKVYEIPTIEQIPTRNIGICFLKSVSLSPASKKFVTILKKGLL